MANQIAVQFVFEPGEYDQEFHRLDDEIAEFAKGLVGFISSHSWVSPDGKLRNSIYFFENMEPVKELSQYPAHLEAKFGVKRWYKGYQILITEVTHTYGDGNLIYP